MTTGQVIEVVGGTYTVSTTAGTFTASLRGRLKASESSFGKVVIGDRVGVSGGERGEGGVIERILPRRTTLVRRKGDSRMVRVVAANLDRLLVVTAVADPLPSRDVIDRMLVMGESGGMDCHLVLTKGDLLGDAGAVDGAGGAARGIGVGGAGAGEAEADLAGELTRAYQEVGYFVLLTSVVTGQGIDTLRAVIQSGSCALVGPSGVGKSSLLNRIQPDLCLRTREVGRRSRTGKHTTVSSRLISLEGGGQVADTPGFSDVGLGEVRAAELERCFPEFRPWLGQCRFRDCVHIHEPGCAVLGALAEGRIQPARHQSYCTIWEGLTGVR